MVNKQRLMAELLDLIRIDSLSYEEDALAKVLVDKLEQLEFQVCIDNAGTIIGGETGN